MAEDFNATGVLRIPGLGYDGVQWDDMVTKLCKVEQQKFDRLSKWKADWKTRYEAFDQIRSELVTLQSALQKLNTANKFLAKTSTSSKPEVATATLGDNAVAGDYVIKVEQVATKGITSINTGKSDKFESFTKDGGLFEYTIGGTNKTINIPAGTSLEGLKNIINNHPEAKQDMSASLINSGDTYILQISTKKTGSATTLTIDNIPDIEDNTKKPRWEESKQNNVSRSDELSSTNIIWQDADYLDATNTNVTSPREAKFTWKEDGQEFSVQVKHNSTYSDLIAQINTVSKNKTTINGVESKISAELITDPDGKKYIKLSSEKNPITDIKFDPTNGATQTITKQGAGGGVSFPADSTEKKITYTTVANTFTVGKAGDTFTWTDNTTPSPKAHSVTLDGATTAQQLVELINKEYQRTAGNSPTATVARLEGGKLYLEGTVVTTPIINNLPATNLTYLTNTNNTKWMRIEGQDAKYTINGWENTSQSNTLTDDGSGLTFTIKGKGDTTISVALDTEKITENVQSFIDAVNTVRKKFKELTSVDDNKELMDLKNADSQFEMEKGSALTGNYGIQMIESRLKDIVSSFGLGFAQAQSSSNPNGDIFSSLAEIGITTNSDESSDNYGLLELRTSSSDTASKWSAANFSDALEKDPEAVALLFSATTENGTTRKKADFSFEARSAATENGTYTVDYELDEQTGKLSSIKIGGKEYDSTLLNSNNIFIVPEKDKNGGASGGIEGLQLSFKTPIKDANGNTVTGTFSGNVVVSGTKGKAANKNDYGENSYTESNAVITYSGAAPQTKAGTYDIRYQVIQGDPNEAKYATYFKNDDGTIDVDARQRAIDQYNDTNNGKKFIVGTINGQKAIYAGGILKMDISDPKAKDDPARGVEVSLDMPSKGCYVAEVSVREGKVNQLIDALKGKNTIDDPGILDSEHGTLAILKNNYRDIMDSAQAKMEKEQKRLDAFKANLILKYARLEKKLTEYNKKNDAAKSQIQQLSGNSSK